MKNFGMDNDGCQLVLNLRRVVELVVCPVLNSDVVAEMNDVIQEYVDRRVKTFPSEKLKPKHCFISHYPELSMEFGPPLRLWALRFESKHSYFKSCIRISRNFKNLTSSLANKHQLL
jgi:hypothetical protein